MNRRNAYIILAIAVILVAGSLLLIYARQKGGYRWNWYAGYQTSGRYKNHPYGMGKLVSLLSNRTGEGDLVPLKRPVKSFFEDENLTGVYICIGYYPYYNTEDISSLMNFVSRGNTAFIAVNDMPEELIDAIGVCYEDSVWNGFLNLDKEVITTTLPESDPGRTYRFGYHVGDSLAPFSWRYLNPGEFNTAKVKGSSLGMIENKHDCFFEIYAGKGKLMIHSNPVFFSNYFIITDDGYRYASRALSFITPDMDIFFDHYSPAYPGNSGSSPPPMGDSWLGFIINSPGLQWAWASLLLAALLFLVFRSRRRQSPIPVVEPNLNSSMEYMHSVATIFSRKKDFRGIALQMKQLLMMDLAIKYKIKLNMPENELARMVTARTGVPENTVKQIFTLSAEIENTASINKKCLIQWYSLLQKYYSYNK